MERRTLYLVGGGLALGVGAFWWANQDQPGTLPEQLAAAVTNWITRGQRLTRTTQNANGDVDVAPAELAAAAAAVVGRSVSLDEYALARMLASEEERSSPETKIAIAWVALNEAARRGVSISALLLRDNGPGDGLFGEQLGRYAATGADPYEGDLQVAQAVLSGQVGDPTGGAIHFFRPELQDKLYAKGKVRRTAAEIDADWGGGGYSIDGVEPGLRFYA